MNGMVHPPADDLGGLVENEPPPEDEEFERDTSWRWMAAIAVAVGLLAWFTR